MTEQQIYDSFVMSGTDDFAFVVEVLRRQRASWCVIGGMAVNTYVSPVYTADLDIVVVTEELPPILEELRAADFRIKHFPHSVNVQRRAGPAGRSSHMLMVQFSTTPEYQSFFEGAELRPVLGMDVPVAGIEDLIRSKLAAWESPDRRYSKHVKDEADLVRLGESYPHIRQLLPVAIQEGLERQDRTRGVDPRDAM